MATGVSTALAEPLPPVNASYFDERGAGLGTPFAGVGRMRWLSEPADDDSPARSAQRASCALGALVGALAGAVSAGVAAGASALVAGATLGALVGVVAARYAEPGSSS